MKASAFQMLQLPEDRWYLESSLLNQLLKIKRGAGKQNKSVTFCLSSRHQQGHRWQKWVGAFSDLCYGSGGMVCQFVKQILMFNALKWWEDRKSHLRDKQRLLEEQPGGYRHFGASFRLTSLPGDAPRTPWRPSPAAYRQDPPRLWWL